MKIKSRILIEDMTGPWSLHIPMLLFGAPLAIISSTLQDFDHNRPVSLASWLFASTLGYALLLVFALTISQINKKFGIITYANFYIYLFICFFLGATKGVVTGLVGGYLDPANPLHNSLGPRLISSGFIGMLAIPAGSAFLAGRQRFLNKRETLIKEAIRLQSLNSQNQNAILQMRQSVKVDTETELGKSVENILRSMPQAGSSFNEQWNALAISIKSLINNEIRPISQNLWKEHNTEFPILNLKDIVRLTIRRFVFPIWWVLLISEIATLGDFVRHPNGQTMLVRTGWTAIAIVVPYFALKPLVDKKLMSGNLGLVAYLASSTALQFNAFNSASSNNQVLVIINSSLFCLFLFYILAAFGSIKTFIHIKDETLASLSELVDSKRISAYASEVNKESINRDVARYLHGHLQSRLMAMALAIEQASENQDITRLNATLAAIKLELDNPMNRFEKLPFQDVQACTQHLHDIWSGICDLEIDINVDPSSVEQTTCQNLYAVIEETVTNAVRHGSATSATVSIKPSSDGQIYVEVIDDGLGLLTQEPGLGSALFSATCGKNWTLSNNANGIGVTFRGTLDGQGLANQSQEI